MKLSRPFICLFQFALTAALLLIIFTSCSDMLLEPERQPAGLIVSESGVLTVSGEKFELSAKLVDGTGDPFKVVPAWVDTVYTGASGRIIKIDNGKVITVHPGVTELGIEIAGFFETVDVRVAPHLYITQSVQRLNRTLRLVEGRDAVIRLFLMREEKNVKPSQVSVELYQEGRLVQTLDYPNQRITPKKISENVSTLALSIPGRFIEPGLAVLIRVGNVTYPRDGTPVSLNVTPIPPFHIRLIPITAGATGKTGDVSESNKKLYLEELKDMFPVDNVKIDLHAPITVPGNPDNPEAQGDFYNQALNAVRAAWLAEGKPDYYYYGVIPQSGGGTVGLAYTSNLSRDIYVRQAVGWDGPGNDIIPGAPETLAHELGHNFGRQHAPCAPPGLSISNVDLQYPYPNASIGAYGFEVDESDLKLPLVYKSFMSYCSPTWISDYTYEALLEFHLAVNPVPDNVQQSQEVLLVWGSISSGELSLKPAFRISAPPTLPKQPGPYTLSGYDERGNRLFSISFAGIRVSRGNTRHFAFAIPVERVNITELAAIRLAGRGMQTIERADVPARISKAKMKTVTSITARKTGAKSVTLKWNSPEYKMIMIKNTQTGEVLGFTRGGTTQIKTEASKLKLYISDGVHTTVAKISVQ